MRMFIRDFLFSVVAVIITIMLIGWWNAPDYEVCAVSMGQKMCYTVVK